MAANVMKDVFPSLIKQPWDASFSSSQIKGGFRGSSLYPIDSEVVL